jgi:hypothetical protein
MSAFIGILKAAPSADIIDKYNLEVGILRRDVLE